MTVLLTRDITECELNVRAGDGRTVEGRVALFDTIIDTQDEKGRPIREVLRRGAFAQTIKSMGERLPLSLYHPQQIPHADQNIVGRSISWTEDSLGQRASFKIVKTNRGDEALEMVREGLIDQFSIGFLAVPSRTKITASGQRGVPALHERSEVNVRHIALVPGGAFGASAAVESIRGVVDADEFVGMKAAEQLLAFLAEITKPT
jgi:HK97 family phage prohead protease